MAQLKTTPMETNYFMVYILRGITYVPHYTKDCFVGPNYSAFEGIHDRNGNRIFFTSPHREYSAHQLEKAGATKVVESLWSRSKFKPVL
jgi:hypothetical protein